MSEAGEDGEKVIRIPVMESATGNIMGGLQAPTAETIDSFLAANQGWEVLPEEDSSSSEDEGHRVERINEEEEKKDMKDGDIDLEDGK